MYTLSNWHSKRINSSRDWRTACKMANGAWSDTQVRATSRQYAGKLRPAALVTGDARGMVYVVRVDADCYMVQRATFTSTGSLVWGHRVAERSSPQAAFRFAASVARGAVHL